MGFNKGKRKRQQKPDFTRVFTQEEEESIYKGILGFSEEYKKDAFIEKDSFYRYLRQQMPDCKATKTQIIGKLYNLRKKFRYVEKFIGKSEEGKEGKDKDVTVPEFESWKMIWRKKEQVESSNTGIGTGEMDENAPDSFAAEEIPADQIPARKRKRGRKAHETNKKNEHGGRKTNNSEDASVAADGAGNHKRKRITKNKRTMPQTSSKRQASDLEGMAQAETSTEIVPPETTQQQQLEAQQLPENNVESAMPAPQVPLLDHSNEPTADNPQPLESVEREEEEQHQTVERITKEPNNTCVQTAEGGLDMCCTEASGSNSLGGEAQGTHGSQREEKEDPLVKGIYHVRANMEIHDRPPNVESTAPVSPPSVQTLVRRRQDDSLASEPQQEGMAQGKTSTEIVPPATKKSKASESQSDASPQGEILSKEPAVESTISVSRKKLLVPEFLVSPMLRKRGRMSDSSAQEVLNNHDMMYEILLLLPRQTIFSLIQVSKTSLMITLDPGFRKAYQTKWNTSFSLIGFFMWNSQDCIRYNSNFTSLLSTKKIGHLINDESLVRSRGYYIDSSNGCLLFGCHPISYYFWNPETPQKTFEVPEPPDNYEEVCMSLVTEASPETGFCKMICDGSPDKGFRYKVFRAQCYQSTNVNLMTFSSRTNGWSYSKLTCPEVISLSMGNLGRVIDGIIYWQTTGGKVAIYDTKKEQNQIKVITLPRRFNVDEQVFGESEDGCLQYGCSIDRRMQVWKLEKVTLEWKSLHRLKFADIWRKNPDQFQNNKRQTSQMQLLGLVNQKSDAVYIGHEPHIFICYLNTKVVEKINCEGRASSSWELCTCVPYFRPVWPSISLRR